MLGESQSEKSTLSIIHLHAVQEESKAITDDRMKTAGITLEGRRSIA